MIITITIGGSNVRGELYVGQDIELEEMFKLFAKYYMKIATLTDMIEYFNSN